MTFSTRFIRRALCLAAVPLFLAACGPDEQQRADYAAVERSGVSPAVYDKMINGDDLSIYDVAALSRARVNDGIIIRYLRDQDSAYYITPQDYKFLQQNGVSQSVIDFMARNSGYGPYGPGYGGPVIVPAIGVGVGFGGGGRWR